MPAPAAAPAATAVVGAAAAAAAGTQAPPQPPVAFTVRQPLPLPLLRAAAAARAAAAVSLSAILRQKVPLCLLKAGARPARKTRADGAKNSFPSLDRTDTHTYSRLRSISLLRSHTNALSCLGKEGREFVFGKERESWTGDGREGEKGRAFRVSVCHLQYAYTHGTMDDGCC